MDLARLDDVFPEKDIEWRSQSCGESNGRIWCICLAYITNRAIQERLDQVCGKENWRNEFSTGPDGGVICGISIRIPRGDGNYEWVTKWDGAPNTDVDGVKGGLSNAMKRAAVQWGCGRYLYRLEEGFAQIDDKGIYRGKLKDGKTTFRWNPPPLPKWALPITKEPEQQPKADTPEPKASTKENLGDQAKVKSALAKIVATGTIDELFRIEEHANKLAADGTITKAQRETIQKAIVRAATRINGVEASPHNPENKS